MCTVIFIPTDSGVIFSSNRDESPLRARALLPKIIPGESGKMIYPIDSKGAGTWAGVHQSGHVIILLNGANTSHEKRLFDGPSRGLIVKELLDSSDPLGDWIDMDLRKIEPFTLVLWQKPLLAELVWNGERKQTTYKNASVPHLWSSSTLYDEAARIKRRMWFQNWIIGNAAPSVHDLYRMLLHHNESDDGFIMNRNESVKTLSISLIAIDLKNVSFQYADLVTNSMINLVLALKKTAHETNSLLVQDTGYKN